MPQFAENINEPAVYFKTLHMMNVRCFKGDHTIDLSNNSKKPTQWTVILGNNNTGKTTILRALGDMNKFEKIPHEKLNKNAKKDTDYYGLIFKRIYDLLTESKSQIKVSFVGMENELPATFFDGKKTDYGSWTINRDNENISQSDGKLFSEYVLKIKKLNLIGYGTSRFMSNNGVSDDSTAGLFDNKTELLNAEKWLRDLETGKTKQIPGAEARYEQVEKMLCGGLLPDVTEIKITTIPDKSSFETFPEFLTPYGWVRLRDLGYGYQATLAWVADLAKRMFDRYPDLENPLHGPVVVLVDEIDLHLHPEWQRTVVKYLSDLFPHTQFIVTAHSPLIVQSAKDVNVIMLEKDEDENKGINIRQRFGSFQGWTVDEILTELMSLGERTRSQAYLDLMAAFENALLENDYQKAQVAYNQLDVMLSPSSYQRKVLQIQMSSLMPVGI
jgi:AAA domain, putative AbiEii toxin, Type IV TA system